MGNCTWCYWRYIELGGNPEHWTWTPGWSTHFVGCSYASIDARETKNIARYTALRNKIEGSI